MTKVEILSGNDEIIFNKELPFVPVPGDYISIEKDDYFTYYLVTARWIRIGQDNSVSACVSVEIKD